MRSDFAKIYDKEMSYFMKNQKGFIQIPLLIAIIAGVLLLGGVGYLGVRWYQNYQTEKVEKEKQARGQVEAQQKALELAQTEIEKLKQESETTKQKQDTLEGTIKSGAQKPHDISISAAELDLYLSGVVRISCSGGAGSGSLWSISGQGYRVLTNQHVIEDENGTCRLDVTRTNNNSYGSYDVALYQKYSWNNSTDATLLDIQINNQLNDAIVSMTSSANESTPVNGLNYKISDLRKCPSTMPLGSPVAIIGYPAFAQRIDYYEGKRVASYFRTVTNGIISAHDRSLGILQAGLPAPNYLVSNKIDSGNSGGMALSKERGGLCVLGIPTWLTIGNYETQGLIQNIHNIMYEN